MVTKVVDIPSFEQVFDCLRRNSPARCVSSRGTQYEVRVKNISGRDTIVAYPRQGRVCIHSDCWGQAITCQGTRAGGIYNGNPSIYDWFANCEHK